MTTRTFHDLYDVIDLVSMLKCGMLEMQVEDGEISFCISNYTKDGELGPYKSELLKIGKLMYTPATLENTEKAYKILSDKINSGDWEKKDDCA